MTTALETGSYETSGTVGSNRSVKPLPTGADRRSTPTASSSCPADAYIERGATLIRTQVDVDLELDT